MKRFVFLIIVLGSLLITQAAPTWAQDAAQTATAQATEPVISTDPAAYVPVNTPVYLELDTSAQGQQTFNAAARLYLGMIGVPLDFLDTQPALDLVVANRLPTVSSVDIIPWVGDHAALVLNEGVTPEITDYAFVLPIRDAAGAAAFVDKLKERTFDVERYGSVYLYYAGTYTVAVGSNVIWLGSAAGVDSLFRAPPENLAQSPAYQRVHAQLPDAPITGYVDGAWLQDQIANAGSAGNPSLATIAETFLQLHPVESAFKTALLNGVNVDGLGIAVNADDTTLTTDIAFAIDADTTTPDAPLTLGSYAPVDSIVVIDSYDVTTFAATIGGYAGLLFPVRSEVFSTISDGTPLPTPTATPTPVPPAAADLIAQIEPIITQVESLAGLSRGELYDLISGEYMVAAFPTDNGSPGAAVWIQSSSPLRVIEALEQASRYILTDLDGTRLIDVERTTVNGVTVALVSIAGSQERLAIGAFDNVLFVTREDWAQQVIDAAAQGDAERAWTATFADQQDGAISIDTHALDALMLGQVRDPALPLSRIDGGLSVSDDGVFKLHLVGSTGE